MSATQLAHSVFKLAFGAMVFAAAIPGGTASNLVWQPGAGFRAARLAVSQDRPTGFSSLKPAETGIAFANRLADATVANNRLFEIGSGVALGDVDGDDLVDIYFCRLEGDNALYRNLGHWRFEDITARAGVACPNQFSTGCAFADIDGDRDLDLLVNSLGGGTRAFLNDGQGHFAEMSDTSLARQSGATSLALADVDGDGDLDLYVTNYRTDTFHDRIPNLRIQTRRQPDGTVGVEPADRFVALPTRAGGLEIVEKGEADFLYINRGSGRFFPVRWDVGVFLDEQGLPLPGPTTDWGLSVMFRDLNGDSLPDLYVCNDFVLWPDRIWFNQGGKRFRAAATHTLRCMSLSSMVADVADINRDGRDDIFVAEMLSPRREFRAWQRPDILEGAVQWPIADPNFRPEATRNTLQLARDDGTYAEIAQLAGLSATDWTWNAAFLDVDLDGWEDLLLATGANHDVQDADAMGEIVRTGGWKTPESRLKNLPRIPRRETASLAFRNRHDLTFEDLSSAWGFDIIGVAHGLALADLDNDGDLDVVMSCLNAPARIFRNDSPAPRIAVRLKGADANTRGIGAKITVRSVVRDQLSVASERKPEFGTHQSSKASNVQRTDSTQSPIHSKDQSLLTSAPTRNGFDTLPVQTQEMICGGRYLSGDNATRVFAAGTVTSQFTIEVKWRSGKRRLISAEPNRIYEIDEAESDEIANRKSQIANSPIPPPLFEDVSSRLRHAHVDHPFDDFARQPLLPRKLSTLGPGICWADVNDDGFDDLLVAGGKGGRLAIFRNNGKGGFAEWTEAPLPKWNPRDQTSALVWHAPGGVPQLVVAESNWEDADTNAAPFRLFPLRAGAATNQATVIRDHRSAAGPLALADWDGDGDLDLFVGGRAVAGRYPEPATSHLLRNDAGTFHVAQRLPELGLVSGAVFTDLDGDGSPELALACEWGPIRLFRNRAGKFEEWNPPLLWPLSTVLGGETTSGRAVDVAISSLDAVPVSSNSQSSMTDRRLEIANRKSQIANSSSLSSLTGLWNGIAAGDFDGDGQMDLVASNWGRNWRTDQPPGVNLPVRMYYGDFAGNGIVQTLVCSDDPWLARVTPWRERKAVAAAIPSVADRMPNHRAYGRAGIQDVLGPSFTIARELHTATTDSMVFLNRSDHFEARPLPIEAQFTPGFGISVADFDGDGNEDVFLAQNFFGVDAETSRHDAGTGLILLGDGRGRFRALGPREAGVAIYGEQRGSAVADFDGDGRVDLAVAQNNGPTVLLRNIGGVPGVRVALRGPRENPNGVGAVVRLAFGDRFGPAREIHAGSGYWSHNSAVSVLAAPSAPTAIQVRWPGAQTQVSPWPNDARSIAVPIRE